MSRIDVELDNLRAALRWLIVRGEVELAQRLIGATRTVWISRSYPTEGRRWLEAVFALDPPQARPASLSRTQPYVEEIRVFYTCHAQHLGECHSLLAGHREGFLSSGLATR